MNSTRTRRGRRTALSAVLLAPALLFGLAACAPAANPEPPASSDAAGEQLSYAQWQLTYAECMRGQGVDMPDPDGNGTLSVPLGADQAATEAANRACTAEVGEPPAAPADQQGGSDDFLAWARQVAGCYREHGYDVPDPADGEMIQFPDDVPMDVQTSCGGGPGTVTQRSGQ